MQNHGFKDTAKNVGVAKFNKRIEEIQANNQLSIDRLRKRVAELKMENNAKDDHIDFLEKVNDRLVLQKAVLEQQKEGAWGSNKDLLSDLKVNKWMARIFAGLVGFFGYQAISNALKDDECPAAASVVVEQEGQVDVDSLIDSSLKQMKLIHDAAGQQRWIKRY